MNLADLGVLYGMATQWRCRVSLAATSRCACARFGAALGSALAALAARAVRLKKIERDVQRSGATETEAALLEGHEAVRNTPLEPLLPRTAVDRMLRELRQATERYAELSSLLAKKGFDRALAEKRVARLEQRAASPRTLASARLHLENVARLHSLAARDRRALEERSELIAALRTRLVFARYSGSSPVEASDIVTEVWARVEMLGTSSDGPPFELDSAPKVEEYALGQARPDRG